MSGGQASSWSEDELAYLAAISGAIGGFPTVQSELFTDAESDVSDAVIEAVVRSLMARSLLSVSDGRVEAQGDFARVGRLAFSASLVALISAVERGGESATWVGFGPAGTLVVEVGMFGSRRCWALPVVDPATTVIELGGLEGSIKTARRNAGDAPEPVTTADLHLEDLLAGDSAVSSLIEVQTGWKDGEVTVGGIVTFAVQPGRVSLAQKRDSEEGSWSLTNLDEVELRDLVARHLPQSLNQD